jgi:hypothetical protein
VIENGLKKRLLVLLALSEQGVGGERENADVILTKLLRKHGLTMADIDDRSQARERVRWKFSGDEERTILAGLIESVIGHEAPILAQRYHPVRGKPRMLPYLVADVTKAQRATIDVAWEVMRDAWKRARSEFMGAFILKNGLFDVARLDTPPDETPQTPEQRQSSRRLAAMMDGIEQARPRKRIAAGA